MSTALGTALAFAYRQRYARVMSEASHAYELPADQTVPAGSGPTAAQASIGQQPHPPPGWTGGNRLAIHGTNAPSTIGTPASAGCLRAADRDLAVLMRRVPLGTPVVIRG